MNFLERKRFVCVLGGVVLAFSSANAGQSPAPAEPPDRYVTWQNELLDVNVREAPLVEVLREISHRTGLQIECADGCQEAVSVAVFRLPVLDAVRTILRGRDFVLMAPQPAGGPAGAGRVVVLSRQAPVTGARETASQPVAPPPATETTSVQDQPQPTTETDSQNPEPPLAVAEGAGQALEDELPPQQGAASAPSLAGNQRDDESSTQVAALDVFGVPGEALEDELPNAQLTVDVDGVAGQPLEDELAR